MIRTPSAFRFKAMSSSRPPYLGDADALLGRYLVKRHRRPHRSPDAADFNAEATQRIDDFVLIGILLVHVDGRLVVVEMFQQVERGIMVVFQVKARIVRLLHLFHKVIIVALHTELHMLRRLLTCRTVYFQHWSGRGTVDDHALLAHVRKEFYPAFVSPTSGASSPGFSLRLLPEDGHPSPGHVHRLLPTFPRRAQHPLPPPWHVSRN